MTPVIRNVIARDPNLAQPIERYLRKHRKTRFRVECSIGIWKEQFPCLNHLCVRSPRRCCTIIYSCAALHNMQNHYKHGSYRHDDILNGLANIEDDEAIPLFEPFPLNEDEEALNEMDGIERQRQLIEYFVRD